jgi:hypothetical protein
MERTQTTQRPVTAGNGGPGAGDEGEMLDALLAQEILSAADRILDGIRPVNAQQYLEQNQQRGGE